MLADVDGIEVSQGFAESADLLMVDNGVLYFTAYSSEFGVELCFYPLDGSEASRVLFDMCAHKVDDGIIFLPDSVHATAIRADAHHTGARVVLLGIIDSAQCHMQIDIGFGDAVTPGPVCAEYPVMLTGFEAPKLKVYPHYTVVAEKCEALATLGIANSRMKDYLDLWILSRHTDFDGDTLRDAMQRTFDRRNTILTRQVPIGLTDEFAMDAQKQIQWQAFLRKNRLVAVPLIDVVQALATFMQPVFESASDNTKFAANWPSGGPWSLVKKH